MDNCRCCGRKSKKRGWDNNPYCSEICEREVVGSLHGSMPGCRGKWMPQHVSTEISKRWYEY